MSWSVSASGSPAEVRGALSAQFKYPLAEKPYGINDDGERETVQKAHELIEQVLSTYGGDTDVAVSAYGHGAFTDQISYQQLNITIQPMARPAPAEAPVPQHMSATEPEPEAIAA